jgi:PEP-CTERM motif
MSMTDTRLAIPLSLLGCLVALPAVADTTFFSTGNPDRLMATATRPASPGKFEIESADDFTLGTKTSITDATFTGLLTGGDPTVGEVRVEIYRVFPADSNVARTSGAPTFSTPEVPTRANSPSDVEFADRDTSPSPGNLTFTITDLGSFTANNSVLPGGIHPEPGQTTGGNGSITGEEVEFHVNFTTPFILPADHYFFVPQVQVTTSGDFFWLSAPKTIPAPADLQSWTRDDISPNNLAPDWLRVGTDIVGGTPAPTFNAAFSLSGSVVPEPSTWAMMLLGFAGLGFAGYRHARKARPASA